MRNQERAVKKYIEDVVTQLIPKPWLFNIHYLLYLSIQKYEIIDLKYWKHCFLNKIAMVHEWTHLSKLIFNLSVFNYDCLIYWSLLILFCLLFWFGQNFHGLLQKLRNINFIIAIALFLYDLSLQNSFKHSSYFILFIYWFIFCFLFLLLLMC